MGQLHHKCMLATCSITTTNKQNNNVIDYDYIESNHDYNRDQICLETFWERKENSFAWCYFQTTRDMNECNKRNYQSIRMKHRKKRNNITYWLLCRQQTSCVTRSLSQGENVCWKKLTGHFGGGALANTQKRTWEVMVNPDVDAYTKTLNQRKTLRGVLLTLNQLNVVLNLELAPKKLFLCPMLSLK